MAEPQKQTTIADAIGIIQSCSDSDFEAIERLVWERRKAANLLEAMAIELDETETEMVRNKAGVMEIVEHIRKRLGFKVKLLVAVECYHLAYERIHPPRFQ